MKTIAYAIILMTMASLLVHGAENETAENGTFYFGDATNDTFYSKNVTINETSYLWDATNNTLYFLNATNDTDTWVSPTGVILREGDIIFGGNGGGKGWGDTGHLGILVNDNGELVVREAHPLDLYYGMSDGVQNKPINHFCSRYATVCAYRVTDADDDKARQAANKAKEFSGKYWLGSGNDLANWYCSELVYKAYKLGPGINLDPSFTDPRCKWCWGQCKFVSPCDLIKGGKLESLGCVGELFDCSIRWQGC
jgi:uncharacterized protein YycO